MLAMMQENVLHSSVLHVRLLLCSALCPVCTRHVQGETLAETVHYLGLFRDMTA